MARVTHSSLGAFDENNNFLARRKVPFSPSLSLFLSPSRAHLNSGLLRRAGPARRQAAIPPSKSHRRFPGAFSEWKWGMCDFIKRKKVKSGPVTYQCCFLVPGLAQSRAHLPQHLREDHGNALHVGEVSLCEASLSFIIPFPSLSSFPFLPTCGLAPAGIG
jgi:hypothetical protein